MDLAIMKNIGEMQEEHEKQYKNRMNKNQINKYKNAINNLTSEVGYIFCHTCCGYGKIDDYHAITCNMCGKWTCDNCLGIEQIKIIGYDSKFEVCSSCIKILPKKSVMLCIYNRHEEKSLGWDKIVSIFNDPDYLRLYFTDIISEHFDSGEYYQYEVNPMTRIFEGHDNLCHFGISFDLKEGEDPDDDNVDLDELVDDLMSYFMYGMDGFHFDNLEFLKNEGSVTIDLY